MKSSCLNNLLQFSLYYSFTTENIIKLQQKNTLYKFAYDLNRFHKRYNILYRF